MKYKAKSIIIGRKKKESEESETRPCFISLFDENDPHIQGTVPKNVLDFNVRMFIIKNLEVKYMPLGNDLVINNLSELDIRLDNDTVIVTGKQG